MRACTPAKTRKQRSKTPLPLVHPACKVLTRSPLLHACLQHMLHNYDACNSAATTARRVRPDLSETNTTSLQYKLASANTKTSRRKAHLRTNANTTPQTKRLSVQPLQRDRTTQAPSQMHLPTSSCVPYPKPQRQPTPLTCPRRLLLRVPLNQTHPNTNPKRPVLQPTPSRRAEPRQCLRPHLSAFFAPCVTTFSSL